MDISRSTVNKTLNNIVTDVVLWTMILKMVAASSSKMSVTICQSKKHHIPEDMNLSKFMLQVQAEKHWTVRTINVLTNREKIHIWTQNYVVKSLYVIISVLMFICIYHCLLCINLWKPNSPQGTKEATNIAFCIEGDNVSQMQ